MEPPAHAPYGLLQLSAVVDQLGYKIAVLDNNAFRLPIDALRQEIKGDVQPKTIRIGMQPSSPMFGQIAPKEFGTKDDVLEITILPDGAITAPSDRFLEAVESGVLSKSSVEALKQEIKNFQLSASEGWDVIGIGGLSTQYKYIREIAKVCKTEFPAAVLVGGGGFATSQPREMMRWIPEFDCFCMGEGIITFKEILEHLEDQNWKTVKGLAYREGSKIKLSAMRPLIEEFYHCEEDCKSEHLTFEKALAKDFACQCGAKLANNLDEEIPFPAYEYGAVETYLMNSRIPYSVESMRPDCRRMDVLSSYGCPMRCTFCFHCGSTPYCQSKIYGKTVSGKPFRQHSPRYVLELIDHLRRHYLINFVSFIDENFTVNKLWYNRFCSELENFDLATLIHWGILSHVKTIDQKMLERGHDVGLSYVSYGGESANERLLKECKKGQTKTDMESAITATQAANVNTIMTFILGLPDETIDDVIETAQFFVDNQIHCVPFFAQAYPATELYEKYKDKIIEQHMTEEEKEFLENPDLSTYTKMLAESFKPPFDKRDADAHAPAIPSKTSLRRELPMIKEKIRDRALERWVLELDDATKLSANLTDFNDVELAGLQYMLARWEIDRLKQFKKQLAFRKITGDIKIE